MAYVKTVWIDDETVISAASLNKIENKLFELDGISTNLKQEDSRINQKIADEVANRQSEITSVNAKIGVLETKSDSLAQSDALINSRDRKSVV